MKILVAVDNSKSSMAAVRSLAKRLWPEKTEFLVVHVLEPIPEEYLSLYPTYSTTYSKHLEERLSNAEELVKKEAQHLGEIINHATVRSMVLEGPVADCIIEKAKDWQANVIVLGSHGNSRLKQPIGSDAEMVLSGALCSVEIIRS